MEPDNYKIYGEHVQNYWKKAESNIFDGMSKVIGKASKINHSDIRANYITSYCNEMQTKAFKDGKQILNDVIWTQNKTVTLLKSRKIQKHIR